MQAAVLFSVCDVGCRYAFYVAGQGFDVGYNRNLDNRMPRIVCLKLVAAFDRA